MVEYKAAVARAAGQFLSSRPDFMPAYQPSPEFWKQTQPEDAATDQRLSGTMASDDQPTSRFSASTQSSGSTHESSIFSDNDRETVESTTSQDHESSPRKNTEALPPIPTPSPKDIDDYALGLIEADNVQQSVRQSSNFITMDDNAHTSCTSEMFLPPIFKSLCVCDPNIKGHPVQLRSKFFSIGPRGLKVGRCEFLNLPGNSGEDCILSSRPGSDGRPQFVLEYTTSLISQESKSCTYIMASQMDMTLNIRDLATSLLRKFSELDRCDTELTSHDPSMGLGSRDLDISDQEPVSVDWLAFADEDESQPKPVMKRDIISAYEPGLINLREIVEDVKFFHRDSFILAPAKGTGFWQISSASSSLCARGVDLHAGLSSTPAETLRNLGASLSEQQPITMVIKWGPTALEKRLYCVPMFRKDLGCWLCFLVDASVPNLWDLED